MCISRLEQEEVKKGLPRRLREDFGERISSFRQIRQQMSEQSVSGSLSGSKAVKMEKSDLLQWQVKYAILTHT